MSEEKIVRPDIAISAKKNISPADDALEYHPEDIDLMIARMDGRAS